MRSIRGITRNRLWSFCGIHSRDNINRDIEEGCVRVLWKDGRLVGTGSRKGNHITRVSLLRNYRDRGAAAVSWRS